MHAFALKARYVVPVSRPPIADGVVQLVGPRIAAVGRSAAGTAVHDLGDVALLPGLINAHTHLEFSSLTAPLGRPGIGLADWIREVLAWRGRQEESPDIAIARGLRECVRHGTTALGNIVTDRSATAGCRNAPSDVTLFFEAMALPAARIDEAIDQMCRTLDQQEREHSARQSARRRRHSGKELANAPSARSGISPHAPYTVHPELLRRLVELANARRLPLAFHLAESREELRLLRTGGGPLRGLLEERDAWDATAVPLGTRPLDYLNQLGRARRVLIIHGNYLDDEELGYLAARADRMSLVYCPRTHAFFHHDPYLLARALALGVDVVLGTDGRASNPDLSLLEEMRYVARHHPTLTPETVVQMGTQRAARALGRGRRTGSIAPGKLANLTAVALTDRVTSDPYAAILHGSGGAVATWYRGTRVWNRADANGR